MGARCAISALAPDEVLRFWFEEVEPEDWFRKHDALDARIRDRFGALYEALASGVPASWLAKPDGILAAVIVLDQFPRNMFRGEPRAFATDVLALRLAKRAIAEGLDRNMTRSQRLFLYMPFQHSEHAADQARSVELFTDLGNAKALRYAKLHKQIIDRFGRFPHRNETLGRTSTAEELEFLKQPGSSF